MKPTPRLHPSLLVILALVSLLAKNPSLFSSELTAPQFGGPVPILADHLSAYWPMTETSGTRYDVSGNGQDLLVNPGPIIVFFPYPFPPPVAEPLSGRNYAFNTGTDAILLPIQPGPIFTAKIGSCPGPFGDPCAAFRQAGWLNNWNFTPAFSGSNITVSLWVRLRDGVATTRIMDENVTGGWLVLESTAGVLHLNFFNTGDDFPIAPISANEWHHILVSYDGLHFRILLDGVKYTVNAAQSVWASFSSGISFGAAEPLSLLAQGANMDLCQVGVWSRILTDSEAGLLYQNGEGLPYPFTSANSHLLYTPKADYSGVFTYPQSSEGTSGYISLSSNAKGRFTGKFRFGSSTAGFKGALDEQGNTTVSFNTHATGPITLALHYADNFTVPKLSGTASGWYFASTPVELTRRTVIPKHELTPDAGTYNLTLSGTGGLSNAGTGTLAVTGDGKTKLVVTLADGTKVVATGRMGEGETWAFYNTLYYSHGALGGTLLLDANSSTCSGTLYWYKPATKSKTYPGAVSATLSLSGTRQ